MTNSSRLTLESVEKALATHDLDIARLIKEISGQSRDESKPKSDTGYTYYDFEDELLWRSLRTKTREEQSQARQEKVALLDSENASEKAPDRFRIHEIIYHLWKTNDTTSRTILLEIIRTVPLVYGPWKAIKKIFKESEAADDTEIYGAIAARLDMALASRSHRVSSRTIGYLCRRAWRYLRRIGEYLPATYPDVASDFLVHYEGYGDFDKSWIFNHICFHETRAYGGTRFKFSYWRKDSGYQRRPKSWLKTRAFGDLWKRSARPLFSLLERAQHETVRKFAVESLKADFRAELREIEAEWIARLINVCSESIDELAIWILQNVPKFEQARFRELNLHDSVICLLESESSKARDFAVGYVRTHARDLSLDELIRIANSDYDSVTKVVLDLLRQRDPRTEIGVEGFGKLLDIWSTEEFAAAALRKHFSAKDLTEEWFADRLLSVDENTSRHFAESNLLEIHSLKKLGHEYFIDLIDRCEPDSYWSYETVTFAMNCLQKCELKTIEQKSLQKLLLQPDLAHRIVRLTDEGKIQSKDFGVEFLKRIATEWEFENDPLVKEIRETKETVHRRFGFEPQVAQHVLAWLGDVRQFSPDQLGFAWLMKLVERSEDFYHDFAVETLNKSFLPADFAPAEDQPQKKSAKSKKEEKIDVDLQGATFVFTGKLSTMSRSEAQKKVDLAKGKNSRSVSKNLDYLVIGDEGSPLYGEGRKGSKQVAAEEHIEEGAEIKIISETAFLQMLSGEKREFSDDAIEKGCQKLWSMLVDSDDEDHPHSKFALKYIRAHHPEICLAETDRPVDPGKEIPDSFLTFERLKPLYFDKRLRLREFALEIARYEFARWSPSIENIVELCESPYDEVRKFVAHSLTCDESVEHRRYRLDPEILTADAVFSFCESRDLETRALGMRLIELNPRLKVPDELFRLTESPDSKVRSFVIRTFWSVFRDRGITEPWQPDLPKVVTTGRRKAPTEEQLRERVGHGVPHRPENLPAEYNDLRALFRRVLFEIPPGRPGKTKGPKVEIANNLPRLPARKAKLNLIETFRDIALEDVEFAECVYPLLCEFTDSRGQSEQAACIVATTRLMKKYPQLSEEED